MKITIPFCCPKCGQVINVTVEKKDLNRWARREGLIQDIFPYLPPTERELFLSGICEECWKKMFDFENEDKTEK